MSHTHTIDVSHTHTIDVSHTHTIDVGIQEHVTHTHTHERCLYVQKETCLVHVIRDMRHV